MKFINILEILENELESRKIRSKDNYNLYMSIDKENKRLRKENELLRKDLAELSKEFIKSK